MLRGRGAEQIAETGEISTATGKLHYPRNGPLAPFIILDRPTRQSECARGRDDAEFMSLAPSLELLACHDS
jgi:hypothetical protein